VEGSHEIVDPKQYGDKGSAGDLGSAHLLGWHGYAPDKVWAEKVIKECAPSRVAHRTTWWIR
jgi:hypothetical protein